MCRDAPGAASAHSAPGCRLWRGIPTPIITSPLETASTPPAPATPRPTPTATSTAAAFPTEAFAAITEDPVPADLAAELQSIVAGEAGVSATVMSAHGTWSWATGKADGVRGRDGQRSVLDREHDQSGDRCPGDAAALEGGELGLDHPVGDHLPSELDFDTNGATIRRLLGHRSGIPDYVPEVTPQMLADPLWFWTPAELLAEIPADRPAPGGESAYGNINYMLLGRVIER